MKLELLLCTDGGERRIEIDSFPALIGRHAGCEIQLDDPRASRRHASIESRERKPFLVDLGSGNGTVVNGLRTRGCYLSPGDEIQVGRAVVRVERVLVEREADRDQDPAVVAAREAAVRRNERALRRRRLISRLAPLAILLAIAGAVAFSILMPREEAPAPPAPGLSRLHGAESELAGLRELAGRAPRVTSELILRVEEAAGRYRDVSFRGGEDRFADLLLTLQSRQRSELSSRLFVLNGELRELLDLQRYGEALELAERETADVMREGPSLTTPATNLRERASREVELAFRRLVADARFLGDLEREEEGIALCEKALPHFEGTSHEAGIRRTIDSLREELRAALEERRRALEELAAASPATPREEEARRGPRPPGLAAILGPALAGGALRDSRYRFGDLEGTPVELTESFDLILRAGETERRLPLAEVPARVQLEMARDASSGEDLLQAARFGFLNDLAELAERILWKYVTEEPSQRSERQAKVDRLLATARGIRGVPEAGFVYDSAHGWEDGREKAEREAVATADRLSKGIAAASTLRTLEHHFEKIRELVEDPGFSARTRGRIRGVAVEGLEALREKLVEQLSGRAKRVGFSNLRLANQELKRRRAEALRIIFDASIYLPEDHPDYPKGDRTNGQEAVDQAVAAVRELWDNAASYAVELDRTAQKLAAMIQKIDGDCFGAMRHRPGKDEAGPIEEILLNLDRKLDLKHYASHRAEIEHYQYNRKVEAYNRGLVDPELPEADREHAIFVNDYREMLGLRRLFIDLRLSRATRKHSAACDAAGRIWHNGPDGSPSSRAQAEGFPGGVAENVAIGYANPRDIWTRGWYRASDHHRNALRAGHTCIGYGYVGRVGTQNFASAGAPFQ